MSTLLLGIFLLLVGLTWTGIVAISNTLLGILAIILGVIYIAGGLGYGLPAVPVRRHPEA